MPTQDEIDELYAVIGAQLPAASAVQTPVPQPSPIQGAPPPPPDNTADLRARVEAAKAQRKAAISEARAPYQGQLDKAALQRHIALGKPLESLPGAYGLKQEIADEYAPERRSVVQFAKTAARDLSDIYTGVIALPALAYQAATREDVNLFEDPERPEATALLPQMWEGIKEEYSQAYGEGIGGFAEAVYERPVSRLLDVLTVATLGGGAAAKAAQVGGKAGAAGKIAKVVGKAGQGISYLDPISMAMKGVGVVGKTPGGARMLEKARILREGLLNDIGMGRTKTEVSSAAYNNAADVSITSRRIDDFIKDSMEVMDEMGPEGREWLTEKLTVNPNPFTKVTKYDPETGRILESVDYRPTDRQLEILTKLRKKMGDEEKFLLAEMPDEFGLDARRALVGKYKHQMMAEADLSGNPRKYLNEEGGFKIDAVENWVSERQARYFDDLKKNTNITDETAQLYKDWMKDSGLADEPAYLKSMMAEQNPLDGPAGGLAGAQGLRSTQKKSKIPGKRPEVTHQNKNQIRHDQQADVEIRLKHLFHRNNFLKHAVEFHRKTRGFKDPTLTPHFMNKWKEENRAFLTRPETLKPDTPVKSLSAGKSGRIARDHGDGTFDVELGKPGSGNILRLAAEDLFKKGGRKEALAKVDLALANGDIFIPWDERFMGIKPAGFVLDESTDRLQIYQQYLDVGDIAIKALEDSGTDINAVVRQTLEGIRAKKQLLVSKGQQYIVRSDLHNILVKEATKRGLPGYLFDTANGMFRYMVLKGSPSWTVNNAVGSTIFQGMSLGAIDAGKTLLRDIPDLIAHPQKLANAIESGLIPNGMLIGLVTEAQTKRHVGDLLAHSPTVRFIEGMKDKFNSSGPVMSALRWFPEKNAVVNQNIEKYLRYTHFKTKLEKQIANQIKHKAPAREFFKSIQDGLNVQEAFVKHLESGTMTRELFDEFRQTAFDLTEQAHLNYRKHSPFERNVLKRIFPVSYSFWRGMTILALTYPKHHPNRAFMIGRMAQALKDTTNSGDLPDYMNNSFSLGIDPETGKDMRINLAAKNPFGHVDNLLLEPSAAAPLIKIAIEQATGFDIFRQRKFTSPGQSFTSQKKVTPDLVWHILSQVPQARIAQDIGSQLLRGEAGTTFSTSTPWDPQLARDKSGEVKRSYPWYQNIVGMTGLPNPTQLDQEAYQSGQEKQKNLSITARFREAARKQGDKKILEMLKKRNIGSY